MTKLCLLLMKFATGIKTEVGIDDFISIVTVEDWFIRVILIQYIVFYVIWCFWGKKKIIAYSIVADFAMSLVFIAQQKPDGWFNALWLFTFGMACSLHKNKIMRFFENHMFIKLIVLGASFVAFGAIFATNKEGHWATYSGGYWNLFKPISGAFLCIAICGIMYCKEFTSQVMVYLGKRSMYLYIIHINVWPAISISDPIERFWVALIISLVLTEFIYQLVGIVMLYIVRLGRGK